MYKKVEMWTVICDSCGKDLNEGADIAAWKDKEDNIPNCISQHWLKTGEKHYCPNCYYFDIDDNIVFKRNLKWRKKT